jgi:hypothetical protein
LEENTRGTAEIHVEPRGGTVVEHERRGAARDAGAPIAPPPEARVREEDLEPHEGLRYIARLFKVLAVLLILLLIGEIVIGLVQMGAAAIPTLLVEATRLIVFAGFLWGAGDIALMLIESNHDLRATRILIGRLNAKMHRLVNSQGDELEHRAANPGVVREEGRGKREE